MKLKSNKIAFLQTEALEIRRQVLSMIVSAHASHIASSYSIVELLVYVYDSVLHFNPKKPDALNRDRFILSKGWGISALYAVLANKGFFSKKLLTEYCKDGSKMIGIATKNGIPGIEATTGSMGHGLPIAVGMALAARLQKQKHRIFVLMGDGECDEGSIWEAAAIAGHHKLSNLTVIIDHNKWQSFGRIKDVLDLSPINKKWEAFNWSVCEVDGHDFSQLHSVFSSIPFKKNQPSVIIAHTIKGKGVSAFEDKNEWHYKTPTDTFLELAKKELSL